MTKRKTEAEKPAPKHMPPPGRKLTPEEAGDGPLAQWAGFYMSDVEVFWKMCAAYVEHVIVPRILADQRRRQGDPTASPKDYACMCPVSPSDRLPICWGLAKGCRFTHRPRPPGPKYWDDPVRHELFKREYRALKKGVPQMKREEAMRFLDKLMAWYGPYRRRERRKKAGG